MIFEGLNSQQVKAVRCIEGPVIVFAGAGSGKTRTLTSRIAHMINNCGISPYNILAITFTNKATKEMQNRLENYNVSNYHYITISTFHSFCARLLRIEIKHLGYRSDFTIIDEEDQLKIISEILENNHLDKKSARYYQKIINYNKCHMTKPDIELDLEVYQKYVEEMAYLGLLDFEDLLLFTYELFKLPNILLKYQERYKYILVDEFQDTNLIQYKIIKMLALKYKNLFLVGDDDQSIYSFRGTNYENANLFKDDFPLHNQFFLTVNYRSTKNILDVCNNLIKNNKSREAKVMETIVEGSVDDVFQYLAFDEKDEAEFISLNLKKLKAQGIDYNQFAILYRNSALARNIELNLINSKIPYKIFGGVSYLKRKEIKDIICYFKLIINENDFYCFKRALMNPSRGIGQLTLEKIDSIRRINKCSIKDAALSDDLCINTRKKDEIKNFFGLIDNLKKNLENDSLVDIFSYLIEEIKYIDYLKQEYIKEEFEDRLNNLMEFKSILVETDQSLNNYENLKNILDNSILESEVKKEESNSVTVSTIHSVKGLEFDVVFLLGLEEDLFPSYTQSLRIENLEEERRIAYVAMTRAKKKLFLTSANRRLLYGKYNSKRPSRFLVEALAKKHNSNLEKVKVIVREKNNAHDYNVSDKVNHSIFGDGIILNIINDNLNIFFNDSKECKIIKASTNTLSKK